MSDFVTIKADIYCKNEKVGRFELVDGVLLKNECYTDVLVKHPCARAKTAIAVLTMLSHRVLPACRCNDWLLNKMGLTEYDVWKIFKHNHGVTDQDFIWFKFDDDRSDLCFDDVRMR